MKKYLNQSLVFAVYGLCCGVYFREFTKFNGFSERTMLGFAHPHVLALGFAWFIIVALFVKVLDIKEDKKLKMANTIYTVGLLIASIMMLIRGTMEVLGMPIEGMLNGAISGIAGIGHIMVAAGLIRFINVFRKAA